MIKDLDTGAVLDQIRDYITNTMLFGLYDKTIEPDESLLQRGVLDSTGVLELVAFLENRFHITVADDEITTDNLDSLASIASYLHRKGVLSEHAPHDGAET